MNALHRTSQKLVDEAVELYHHVPDLCRSRFWRQLADHATGADRWGWSDRIERQARR